MVGIGDFAVGISGHLRNAKNEMRGCAFDFLLIQKISTNSSPTSDYESSICWEKLTKDRRPLSYDSCDEVQRTPNFGVCS